MSACAICKCVQCAWASLTVPKGRSGRAKTNFFLHQPSINEPIFLIRFFKFIIHLLVYRCFFSLAYNGPGIATVADLRASSLSAETKTQAEQRTQNYHLAPLLWLYHVMASISFCHRLPQFQCLVSTLCLPYYTFLRQPI